MEVGSPLTYVELVRVITPLCALAASTELWEYFKRAKDAGYIGRDHMPYMTTAESGVELPKSLCLGTRLLRKKVNDEEVANRPEGIASGDKWINAGIPMLMGGEQLDTNFAKALAEERTEFLETEWKTFGIEDLQKTANRPVLLASGLKWIDAGTTTPTGGKELINVDLANALAKKTNFTKEEWESFGIDDLPAISFIKSASSYFRPETFEISYFEAILKKHKECGERLISFYDMYVHMAPYKQDRPLQRLTPHRPCFSAMQQRGGGRPQ